MCSLWFTLGSTLVVWNLFWVAWVIARLPGSIAAWGEPMSIFANFAAKVVFSSSIMWVAYTLCGRSTRSTPAFDRVDRGANWRGWPLGPGRLLVGPCVCQAMDPAWPHNMPHTHDRNPCMLAQRRYNNYLTIAQRRRIAQLEQEHNERVEVGVGGV